MSPIQIASLLPSYRLNPEQQLAQVRHRLALASTWGISPSEVVVEVGSGQGDMTAVLASWAARVIAIDSAPRDYGAPLTIGESMEGLSAAIPGKIEPHFEAEYAAMSVDADFVVLAMCSWYFDDEALISTLCHPGPGRLGFAEWDLAIDHPRSVGPLSSRADSGPSCGQESIRQYSRSPNAGANSRDHRVGRLDH